MDHYAMHLKISTVAVLGGDAGSVAAFDGVEVVLYGDNISAHQSYLREYYISYDSTSLPKIDCLKVLSVKSFLEENLMRAGQ